MPSQSWKRSRGSPRCSASTTDTNHISIQQQCSKHVQESHRAIAPYDQHPHRTYDAWTTQTEKALCASRCMCGSILWASGAQQDIRILRFERKERHYNLLSPDSPPNSCIFTNRVFESSGNVHQGSEARTPHRTPPLPELHTLPSSGCTRLRRCLEIHLAN